MNSLLAQALELPSSNKDKPTTLVRGPLSDTLGPGILGRQIDSIGDFITALLLIIFPLATGMALIFIVIGSFQIMFSGGDPAKIASAKGKITTALLGVVVISLAWFATYVVDRFFLGNTGVLQS